MTTTTMTVAMMMITTISMTWPRGQGSVRWILFAETVHNFVRWTRKSEYKLLRQRVLGVAKANRSKARESQTQLCQSGFFTASFLEHLSDTFESFRYTPMVISFADSIGEELYRPSNPIHRLNARETKEWKSYPIRDFFTVYHACHVITIDSFVQKLWKTVREATSFFHNCIWNFPLLSSFHYS